MARDIDKFYYKYLYYYRQKLYYTEYQPPISGKESVGLSHLDFLSANQRQSARIFPERLADSQTKNRVLGTKISNAITLKESAPRIDRKAQKTAK